MVKSSLRVELERSVTLQVERFRPVGRKHLNSQVRLQRNIDGSKLSSMTRHQVNKEEFSHPRPCSNQKTYTEIHIFRLCNPLKFDRQLIQLPNLDHRLVSPGRHDMFPIFRRLDFHTTSREREILNQFKRTERVLSLHSFTLTLGISGGFGLGGDP